MKQNQVLLKAEKAGSLLVLWSPPHRSRWAAWEAKSHFPPIISSKMAPHWEHVERENGGLGTGRRRRRALPPSQLSHLNIWKNFNKVSGGVSVHTEARYTYMVCTWVQLNRRPADPHCLYIPIHRSWKHSHEHIKMAIFIVSHCHEK